MTDRDTAVLLQAALQRRAEYGMQTTNTDQQLRRLQERMAPARRRRQLRFVLAGVAAAAVVAGGVALSVALASEHRSAPPLVTPRPSPSSVPHGTLAPGFPIGTYSHPGSSGLTTLRITQNAQAVVSSPDGTAFNDLTFTMPNLVTFDTHNGAACTTVGRYSWAVANQELVLTAVDDACSARRIALTESPWGPVRRTQSP